MIIDANSYWFDERIFHDETLCEQFLAEVPRAYDTEGYLTVSPTGKRQIVIESPLASCASTISRETTPLRSVWQTWTRRGR